MKATSIARELLLDRPYDLVVLQDQSQTPGYLDSDTVSDAELQAALEAVEGDRPLPSGQLNRAESLLRLRDFYGPAIARALARDGGEDVAWRLLERRLADGTATVAECNQLLARLPPH